MSVKYDRAREEEAIINKVFPSQEMEHSAKPLSAQKQETLNVEIFEIGKVSRCFGCASEETFDHIESADEFRSSTMRSFVFFTTLVIAKTLTEFFFIYYGTFEKNEQVYFVQPALDVFELVLTLYTLYCTYLFCSCLSQGLIFEYQPVTKFLVIALMTFAVVI